MKQLILALGLTLGLAACGDGGASKDEARRGYGFASAFATSYAQMARSMAGQGLRSATAVMNACPMGGSVDFTGSGTANALSFTFTFDDCTLGGGYVLDGAWSVTGTKLSTDVDGDLSFTGPQIDFSLTFDLNVDAELRVTGKVAGYDITEL